MRTLKKVRSEGGGEMDFFSYVPRFERSRGTVAFATANTALSLSIAGWFLATRESLVEETLNIIKRFVKQYAHVGV